MELKLDSNDILIPQRYDCDKDDWGYDIALIGLSEDNNKKVIQYLDRKNK